jgi:asparagine synthase (glutamine-hydrolysing)
MNDKPLLLGLFNQMKKVGDQLLVGHEFENRSGSIISKGYAIAIKEVVQVYLSARIYNLEEIRKFLNVVTSVPAELVCELFSREGVKGFRRLNGKFTIIIREPDKTTIVRDRNGEDKMIWFTNEFFTDSYQRVFEFKNFHPQPDLTGLITFLQIGYIPAPVTSLKGLQKVPAGEILYMTNKGIFFEKLFDFEEIIHSERSKISVDDAVAHYRELLSKSIQRRIEGASEVGVLLSGGLDSGGNLAMLKEIYSRKIKTYSIGFKDNPASELPFARMMADHFGSEHHEYQMDGSEIEFLPDIIDYLGDPFSESGVMLNHSVMKITGKEELPVVLGGDGNDQYFGAGVRETAWHYRMRRYGLAPLSKLFDTLTDISLLDNDNLAFRVQFQNQKFLNVMEPELFGLHNYQLKHMFNLGEISKHPYLKEIPHHFKNYEELFLQRNYFLHIRHSVNEVIIHKASRLSEQFGVNLAFPYIDLDIYNFMQKLPIALRAKGNIKETVKGKGVTKYIHKLVVKPKLPQEINRRSKQGGFSPLEIFFKNADIRNSMYHYIRSSSFADSLKNPEFLDRFFRHFESLFSGQGYWFWYKQVKSNQMLNLLIITIWWDKVMENREKGTLTDYLSHSP